MSISLRTRLHFYLNVDAKLGAIQVLRNAVGVGGVSFPRKSVTKVYGSMLLALRGGGWGSNFQEKSVT